MNSQDLTNNNNNRAHAIEQLQELCHALGVDYSYTEKKFTIKLPNVEPLPRALEIKPQRGRKPRVNPDEFSFLKPDPNGLVEGSDDSSLPDELPPTTTPLDEGEPPKGDDEK